MMQKININDLTESELIDLNNKIIERLRFLQQMRDHSAMLEFSMGDRVAFDPPGRPSIAGILVKYNKKTVTIVTNDGQRWNVSPGLIRKADSMDRAPKNSNMRQIE